MDIAIDIQVTHRSVASLKPRASNPRTHSAEQIDRIAASITTFGWTNPILIDPDENVLAGHGPGWPRFSLA